MKKLQPFYNLELKQLWTVFDSEHTELFSTYSAEKINDYLVDKEVRCIEKEMDDDSDCAVVIYYDIYM